MNDIEVYEAYPPIIIRNENNEIVYILKNDYHLEDPKGFLLEIVGEYITKLYFHRVIVYISNYGFISISLTFIRGNEFIASIDLALADNNSEKNKSASALLIKLIRALEDCKLVEYRDKTIEDLLDAEFKIGG